MKNVILTFLCFALVLCAGCMKSAAEKQNQAFLAELGRYQTPATVESFSRVLDMFNVGGALNENRVAMLPRLIRDLIEIEQTKGTETVAATRAWTYMFIDGVTTDLRPGPTILYSKNWKPGHYIVPHVSNLPLNYGPGTPIPPSVKIVFEFVPEAQAERSTYTVTKKQ